MSDTLRVLAVGDTVGSPGRKAILALYPGIKKEHNIDFFVANCENIAGGNGITPKISEELLAGGVDCITLGDHAWDQKEIYDYISKEQRIVRPINYPAGVPGRGSVIMDAPDGTKIGIINVLGRVFLHIHASDPFAALKNEIEQMRRKTKVVIVDIHAEATSEKIALFRYLDGQASLIFGSHTHVQTADEQISPSGTAYITDCGMTGPHDGVIGRVTEQVLKRFLTQMPGRMEVAEGDVKICGVIAEIDKHTGKALKITRHQWPFA